MPTTTALILADDHHSAQVWADGLQRKSIPSVIVFYSGPSPTLSLPENCELIIVDSQHQANDALQVCGLVRTKYSGPILLLTYESDERYLLRAYALGVEECIAKPVSVLIFLYKVVAWLRRANTAVPDDEILEAAGFHLVPKTRQVTTPDARTVRLSKLEFRLLYLLAANHGRVLENDFLLGRLWENHSAEDSNLLTNLIFRLRRKIEPRASNVNYIRTVSGHGYVIE